MAHLHTKPQSDDEQGINKLRPEYIIKQIDFLGFGKN